MEAAAVPGLIPSLAPFDIANKRTIRLSSRPFQNAFPRFVGRPFTGRIDGLFSHGVTITGALNGVEYNGVLFDQPCEVEVIRLQEDSRQAPAAAADEALVDQLLDEAGDIPPEPAPLNKRKYVKSGQYAKKRKAELERLGISISTPSIQSARKAARFHSKRAGAPKGPRSAYVYFEATKKARLRQEPEKKDEILALFDWTKISDAERKPYRDLAAADKVRYEKEMEEYRKFIDENGEIEIDQIEQTANSEQEEESSGSGSGSRSEHDEEF
jgi:hypothetical protein